MEYDFRTRAGQPYDSHNPMYRPTTSSTSSTHGSSLYPRVGPSGNHGVPPASFHQNSSPSSSASGLGIRVTIKPKYRITPPPQLSQNVGEIPRSNFQFDFEFERKILAEGEKDTPNWSRLGLENLPLRTAESTSPLNSDTDSVVAKYISLGLNREAVPLAVAKFGDNPTKVREFVNGYKILRDMGFPSNSVAEALAMFDNDIDKAIGYFLKSSS